MKRIIVMLASLLIMNAALGLTVSIEPLQETIGINNNLTINYEVNLDLEESFNYSIRLLNDENDYLIINESGINSPYEESIYYNVSNLEAGEYQLRLIINSEAFQELAVTSSKNVTITELTNFEISELNVIYTFNEVTSTELTVINNGNTRVSFTTYFLGAESDITIIPQTFSVQPSENKTLRITVKKPESDYNATLNVIGVYADKQSSIQREISVIIPIIELNVSAMNVSQGVNNTIIKFLLTNSGNKGSNYTVNIRTFDFARGFQTIIREGLSEANKTGEVIFELNKTEVTSITIYYSNGTEITELKTQFSIIDYVPFNFELTTNRVLILIIVGIIVGFIIWNKFLRRKRP